MCLFAQTICFFVSLTLKLFCVCVWVGVVVAHFSVFLFVCLTLKLICVCVCVWPNYLLFSLFKFKTDVCVRVCVWPNYLFFCLTLKLLCVGGGNYLFFCLLKHVDVFFYVTKTPESRTRQMQVSFHLPHNTTDFFLFGSALFRVSSLSPGLLPSDCKMTAARPGITSTFKAKRMGKGAPAASPLYHDKKSSPRNPHSVDGLL